MRKSKTTITEPEIMFISSLPINVLTEKVAKLDSKEIDVTIQPDNRVRVIFTLTYQHQNGNVTAIAKGILEPQSEQETKVIADGVTSIDDGRMCRSSYSNIASCRKWSTGIIPTKRP